MTVLGRFKQRGKWGGIGLLLAFVLNFCGGSCSGALAKPVLVFWSWYHDDDLSSARGEVAYLTNRIVVNGSEMKDYPRTNRLKVRPGTRRTAVVRVEVRKLEGAKSRLLAQRIVSGALRSQVEALQIDFDARMNERAFYLELLSDIRQQLPQGIKLSMTALASWCMQDNWLTGSNSCVDEVVPMFFSMGSRQRQGGDFLNERLPLVPLGPRCIGLSLDEPATIEKLSVRLRQFDRIYIFSRRPWTGTTLETSLGMLKRWI